MKRLPIKQSGYDVALKEFLTYKKRHMLICHDDQDMKELIIQRLEADLPPPHIFISPETQNPVNKNRRYIIVPEPSHLTYGRYTDARGKRIYATGMAEHFIYNSVIIFDNFENITYDFMEKLPDMLRHYGVPFYDSLDERRFIFLLDKVKFEENTAARIFPGGTNSITFGYINPMKVDFGLDTEPFVSRFDNTSGKAES